MKTTKLITIAAVSAGLTFGAAAQAHGYKEETVDMNTLPTAVQTTLKDKAGSEQIVRVEKENRNGKTVYEGIVSKNGKEMAISVDGTGKFLNKHNEKTEKKESGEKY